MQTQFLKIRRQFSSLLRKNPFAARMFYHRYLRRQTSKYGRAPILVYQMGKVGSKTIRDSLRACDIDRQVFHVHFLSPERVRTMEKVRRKYLGTPKQHLLEHIWQYMYLLSRMKRDSGGERWKVITLTREPISRNISTFFENLEVTSLSAERYQVRSDYYDFDIVVPPNDFHELTELYFDRMRHDSPLVFFDREIKGVLGIDVYASEFPSAAGYKIYAGTDAEMLLIRLEDLSEYGTRAVEHFLGLTSFCLVNTNISAKKPYADLFDRFKRSIILPQFYIDQMYDSKYMKHFYTEEEIMRLRDRWETPEN